MINWIATNTTSSYCLTKKLHVSHHIIFIIAHARNVRLQHERKRRLRVQWPRDAERPTRCRCVVSFRQRSRSWYDGLASEAYSTWCSQPGVTADFHWFCGLTIIFWADACATQYEFTVVNGQNTTYAFHKVVLRWDEKNCSNVRKVSSWCFTPKIIKVDQRFTELFKKNTGTFFLSHGVFLILLAGCCTVDAEWQTPTHVMESYVVNNWLSRV